VQVTHPGYCHVQGNVKDCADNLLVRQASSHMGGSTGCETKFFTLSFPACFFRRR